jgi:hypothetical protein
METSAPQSHGHGQERGEQIAVSGWSRFILVHIDRHRSDPNSLRPFPLTICARSLSVRWGVADNLQRVWFPSEGVVGTQQNSIGAENPHHVLEVDRIQYDAVEEEPTNRVNRSWPRLNGNVERSRRIDNEKFYRMLEGVVIDVADVFNDKLQEWEDFYNFNRPHGGLNGQTHTNG